MTGLQWDTFLDGSLLQNDCINCSRQTWKEEDEQAQCMLGVLEIGTDKEERTSEPLHLLLSCILATKPVRGICGVSWGMGGGGGAIDTESTAERRQGRQRDRKKEKAHQSPRMYRRQLRVHPNPKQTQHWHRWRHKHTARTEWCATETDWELKSN